MRLGSGFGSVPVERVRAYWDARPCNIRHSPLEIGTREYFDEVERRKYFVEPHIPGFAQFDRWQGKRVLEIGCGIGTDTINFARAGAQVTAVDLSVESLKIAERRATVFGLEDRVEFRFADAEKLSEFVPPEPFDLVYSFGVIHHTPNPDRVMAQVRDNFIMPGSTLKLMVYNRRSWKVMGVLLTEARGAFWRLQDAIARNSEAETGCPVTYTYTPGSARRLAGEGFRVDGIRAAHIFTYRVEDYVQYRYRKAWPFRAMPLFALRGLERLFGWHLCLTATAI